MHRLLVPLVCLAVGIAFGYLISDVQHAAGPAGNLITPGAQASPASTAAFASGTRPLTADKAGEKDKGEEKKKDKTSALTETLDDLVSDFNAKRARKEFEGLALDDIQWCLRYLEGKKDTGFESSLVRAELMRAWARMDVQAAWKAAQQMTDPDVRGYCLQAVAGELAKTSPDAAIKLALSMSMGGDRADVLRAVFGDWGKIDLAAAVKYLNSHPDLPTDNYAINGAIYEVAGKNPQMAAQLAVQLSNEQSRQAALSAALQNWQKKDPAAALEWARKLTDPAVRDSALSALLQSEITSNPLAALKKLEYMSSEEVRRDALRSAMYSWMRKDPAGAMDYIFSNEALSKDENLYWSIGNTIGNLTNQERSAMLARLPEGEAKDRVINNLVQNYSYSGDYVQAVTLLNEMPDSSQRDSSLHNLGQQWGKKDQRGAAAWLNAQPDSSDRDLATAGYITSIASRDPQGALQWASTIPDQKVLEAVYKNIASRWLANDPAAAQNWLTSVTLISDAEKQTLIANAGKRSPSTYVPKIGNRR